jgi:serine kinase of HPr protein (carbohydrate metabolism regulator)
MLQQNRTTVHASCVLIGKRAVLIRGPSGSGKSRLAAELLRVAVAGQLPTARLVADDRVHLFAANERLLAEAPESIRGRIEVRGFGIHEVAHEPLAVVALVIDLAAADAARMPDDRASSVAISGVKLSRLPIAAGNDPLPAALAAVNSLTQA